MCLNIDIKGKTMRLILILSFLLIHLTNPYAGPHALDSVVAEVNDAVITESELNKQMKDAKQQLQARNLPVPEDQVLRKQIFQHFLDLTLQLQFAKNNNMSIDDAELDEIIKTIALQNHYTVEQMQAELQKAGMAWSDYRQNLKKEVLITRLQQASIGRDIHISERQVDSYMNEALDEQVKKRKYHLLNMVIPLSDSPSSKEVEQAKHKALDLLAELNKGADFSKLAIMESSDEYALDGGDLGERYLAELPEVFVPYLKNIKVNEVKGPIRTGNGWQLIKLIGINDADLKHQVTKTHVRHILIKPGPQMTDAQAEQLIHNIYRQIQAGKTFDGLAKQYSVDAATAVKGGDMGWVDASELVPQFAEVMEKLGIGHISVPVKTPFGWHIMQVLERKVEDDSLAYQRQQVRAMLKQKKFTEAVKTWQQHLRAQAFIHILDKSLA